MKIVKVSQSRDREAWLDLRRGIITGTKAKEVAPPKRGTGTPHGIFSLLAEKVAIAKDGEKEADRGLRLEDEALLYTQKKYNLDLDLDPGMWFSDDGKIAVSPDASEVSDAPSYAAEAKCLDSKNHLQGIVGDWEARKKPNYNPLDSLKIGKADYAPQVIQYFVVNPSLQKLYFTLYDDRVVIDKVVHYVIEIERAHVEELIEGQDSYERDALKKVDSFIKILKEIK